MTHAALLMAILLALGAPARAGGLQLSLPVEFPVVGEEQAVRLSGDRPAGPVRLKVVYRPNSATEHESIVGEFGSDGSLRWRPDAPGITQLIAEDAEGKKLCEKRVATCFASTPVSGIVVMILAGILLFGGAATSLVLALKRTPTRADP
jgi:hypothetical protein